MTATVQAAAAPPVDELILPGSAARLRASSGVFGPQDVPRWATRGGASARAAAGALAATALTARRAAGAVGAVLSDAAAALGWVGAAARAAQDDAATLAGHLLTAAGHLDTARDAVAGLASVLDGYAPLLGASAADWAGALDDRERQALLARWRSALETLDAADVRAARALREVAAALMGLRWAVEGEGWLGVGEAAGPAAPSTARGPQGGGALDAVQDVVGSLGGATVDGVASLANAAAHHPGAAAEVLAGLALLQTGITGEVAGTALDLSGVGLAVGVPVNVAAAGAIGLGAGLMTMGTAELGAQAAGDDHVTPTGGGGSGRIDISGANYAQKTAGHRFSPYGKFAGRTIDEVAADLRSGRLSPEDVPVDVIRRDGKVLILNTRSSLALQEAGVPRSAWKVVERTGQRDYERRLSIQLAKDKLDVGGSATVRVRGRK